MQRLCKCLAGSGIVFLWVCLTGTQSAANDNVRPTRLIFVKDSSESTSHYTDTSQALLTQVIRLADLSGQPVEVGIVFFGGEGVTVIGPSAAYASLLTSVSADWPVPQGGTPLDQALEEVLTLARDAADKDVIVVLISDGEPGSGILRPQHFPEVAEELQRQLGRLQDRYQDNDPAFVQRILAAAERAMRTPGTDEWEALQAMQRPAEFEKTLRHAAALKQAGVRFVSVDYANVAALRQIHDAAGGAAEDYVITAPPSSIIARVHELGLTALPNILVGAPLAQAADSTTFQATWPVTLDEVGEAAVVTVVFEPGIPDFATNAELEAVIDGRSVPFDVAGLDPRATLSRDSAGNVVAATLALDRLPDSGEVTFHFRSPLGTQHVPACILYSHLRMADDLQLSFRPTHVPEDAPAPYRVSPHHDVEISAHLETGDGPGPVELAAMEPVLRAARGGSAVRLSMGADPARPHVFLSNGTRFPTGTYDLEVTLQLPSGASFTLREQRMLESQLGDEVLLVDFPVQAGNVTDGSLSRAHLDFGTLGDAFTSKRVALTIRTRGLEYPVAVRPQVVGLTDDHGTSPRARWLTFNRSEVLLAPGVDQQLILTLHVPDNVEESLVDGPYEGRLSFVRTDLNLEMPLRRFTPIAGVADDEPIDPVSFILFRPGFEARSPRGPWNAVERRSDGSALLEVPVSIWQPFARRVMVEARNTSAISRRMSAISHGAFLDREGRTIPSVRLVLRDGYDTEQEVPSGEAGRWVFDFEMDDDRSLSTAEGFITLSGPGLKTLHVPVRVTVRDPLLGRPLRIGLLATSAVTGFFGAVALLGFICCRKYRAGRSWLLRPGQAIAGLVSCHDERGRVGLRAEQQALCGHGSERKKPVAAHRTIPCDLSLISPAQPLEIQGADGRTVRLTSHFGGHVQGTMVSGGPFDERAARQRRTALRRLVMCAALLLLALALFQPPVLAAAQWLLDVLRLS